MFAVYFLLSCASLYSQDSHFSQFQSSSVYLNPALAGSDGNLRVNSVGRYQWPKLGSPYLSTLFSSDYYIHAIRGGLGLLYLYDNSGEGTIISNRFGLSYSPSFPVFKRKAMLKPGFEFAYQYKKADLSKLNFGDQIDPKRGFVYNVKEQQNFNSRTYPDFSIGMALYAKYYLAGWAMHHILEPDEAFILTGKLPTRFTLHGSGFIPVHITGKDTLVVMPSVYLMKQQDFTQLTGNCMVKYRYYSVGMGYRNKDAIIFYAGFSHKYFNIIYSYDYTISALENSMTGGSHEIGLSAFLFSGKKTDKRLFWRGE